MAAIVRVWLLGGFRAEVDGRPVPDEAWRRNKATAVVKLLALAPRHRLHREQLMEALWPELGPDAAAANLRKAVHFARQALAAEHLRHRGELLCLEAERLWVDVEAFEAAAGAGELEAAIALYTGELLVEDRFEPWTDEPRQRLRARHARLLEQRAGELEAAGDTRGAAALLERLAAADPLNEQAATGLMRAYALAGQRHLALATYRQLEARLADELGVEPGAGTRELRDRIAGGEFPAAPLPTARVEAAAAEPAARPGPKLIEERKLVTAVVVDGPPLPPPDPELARVELERWAGLVCELLTSWGGSAEPLVGGSVLAVFGVPRVREDDAVRAMRAALEILERAPPPVRIGVATGEVIVPTGQDASPRGVVGEALDAAARLREAAQPGTAMVAERTCRAAGGRFQLGEPLPEAGGPGLQACRLLGLAGEATGGDPRVQGPLVGREAELGVMLGLFDDVVERRLPRLLTVVGSAGVGKSRLAREAVAAMVARHPGTTVLQGRCLSAGQGVTYWALGELLREACGISLADPAPATRARLWAGLRAILGREEGSDQELEATVFALAATAGIQLPGSPLDGLEPKAVADELARAWPRFATACAAAGPALFLVEDLHWAGEPLLEMLELMVARAAGPLLLVTTTRPELAETRASFGAGLEGHASVSLRPLSGEHSRELLDSLAPADQLGERLRGEVLARAEGNPLFLEQLVLHLASGQGRPGERPRVGDHLPDTVQAVLAARLDTLAPADKRVLQEAAVVGRVFWEDPVGRALGGEPVSDRLRTLERRGLVARRPAPSLPGQAEYGFRHALIHDVAYASIPRARRARAHAEVGSWLEALAGDRRDEVAELLAHHFGRAAAGEGAELAWAEPGAREQVRAKAFEHLLAAGAAARQRFAVARAAELHGQAAALAATEPERLIAQEELGDDHYAAYQGDAAMERWLGALEIARAEESQRAARVRLCRKVAWLMAATPGAFRANPDPDEVERFVGEGMAEAADGVERAWLMVASGVSAQLWRGSEPFGQGERRDPTPVSERIAMVERALATGKAAGLPDLVADADQALGVLYGIAGRYGDVLALARRGLERLPQAGSRMEQADTLRRVAVHTINIEAAFEEGAELAWRCHALSTGTNPHQVMHATWPLLAALYHLGRWRELWPLVEEHVAAFERDPAVDCQFVRDGPVIGATVLVHRGELDRARALAAVIGDPMARLETASAWQARFAVATGDWEAARMMSADKAPEVRLYGPQHALPMVEAVLGLEHWRALAELLPRARANAAGNALLVPHCDRAEGRMHAQAGRHAEAARLLRLALARFEELSVPFEAARTREHLAAVEPAAAARRLRDAARATYQRLGAQPPVGRAGG